MTSLVYGTLLVGSLSIQPTARSNNILLAWILDKGYCTSSFLVDFAAWAAGGTVTVRRPSFTDTLAASQLKPLSRQRLSVLFFALSSTELLAVSAEAST